MKTLIIKGRGGGFSSVLMASLDCFVNLHVVVSLAHVTMEEFVDAHDWLSEIECLKKNLVIQMT